MSAKWRALQHRHRCTYSAVIFPQYYIDSLNLLPSDFSSLKFFTELKELISLNSTYSQVEHVKKVTSSFGELLSNSKDDVVSDAAQFYLEILFLENSHPLHRTLVSVLAKVRDHQSLIGSCLRSLCDEYGVLGSKGKRFSVSRVALSLMSCPKLAFLMEIVEECSISVALDVAFGMNAVLSEIEGGSRPSPIVMEQCQEALSCLYYLLQRFPSRFTDPGGCRSSLIPEDSTIFEVFMKSIIRILKSPAFSRDCWVAAGVSFCAALQAYMNPQELALFLVKAFYHQTSCSISGYEEEFRGSDFRLPCTGYLCLEIEDLPVLGRMCLLRGILTAIPRTVLNTQFILSEDSLRDFQGNRNCLTWTILFDGILPELCNYCDDPIDSHFNFHVLTIMQICFQQIKTSILGGLVNQSENYDPLPENMGNRILRIIWNNLEDPLNQTVKQVHLIFDLLLDIQSTLHLVEGDDGRKSFLRNTAGDLLRLGARCKGRYAPLASLTKRLGAKTVLDMSPNLLFETVHAYVDDDVCCAATSFLKCFLECLRDECWSSYGVERGYVTFRGHCLPPVLYGLVSGVSKLRSNLNTYALPALLEVDVDSIFSMLAFISVGSEDGTEDGTEMVHPELAVADKDLTVDQQVAALVSLLKVSRLLALMEGDIDWYHNSSVLQEEDDLETEGCDLFAFVCIKGIKVKIIVEWLVLALTHVDETLRIEASESLFLNTKTSTLPSPLELNLMKKAVPLNMRCSSTGFQMKWTSLFRKFFARARTALERQFKEGRWQPLACSGDNKVDQGKGRKENIVDRAQCLFCFMKWLSSFLFFSCYPSAPYERKIMAMELILIMINIWPIIPNSQGKSSSISSATCLYPYSEGFMLPNSTLLLVGSIVDSWDRLRESSFRILLNFPTPLPGISSQDTVKELITWAKRLVCSPRVRESDAGALTFRLIFRKYVLELGWPVGALVNVVPPNSQYKLIDGDTQIGKSKFPVIDYILSLIDWLHVAVVEGEKDLSEACKNSSVHGILLTLRYTFDELDWNSNVVMSSSSGMKVALDQLLELIMRVTSLALWVVSADAWYLPGDLDDVVDETFLLDAPVEMDVAMSSPELELNNSKLADNVKPSEQVVMVGSWLAMKEVSLLLGTIIRKIPLPSSATLDSTKHGELAIDVPLVTASDAMLDVMQLEKIGNHFLEILLKMKHNGAIDKTRAGFTALCNRLLCSNDPRLCKMTESWMEQLMERTVAKGQTVDDLLRRSAGIPAAFIALFLSEPEGTPKKLLPRALKWLIDVASMYFTNSIRACSQQAQFNDLHVNFVKLEQASTCVQPMLVDESEKNSKIRDEGVIPMVHAFNVLRASFNDTNLAADTSGFCAEALILSIRSFSSTYWEVRNSACLAYTALVRRMIGFLNVHKRESARRAITGLEFFHRYPALHAFLFDELKIATELLGDGSSEHSGSNIAKVVHPSLCPMLILLSRLKPSPLSSENEDGLDPFLFMPFIRRCSTQSNLRVRVLASRALIGLVSNEKLPNVLLNIANELPRKGQLNCSSISPSSVDRINGIHMASFNSIHGMLLQLSSLLDNNCRNLSDASKKERIFGDLQVLMTCSWIGNPRLCPCPILNCLFLQVLDHMLSIARTCRSERSGSIRSLLLELSLLCLDADVSHGTPFYDPTNIELRRQAAVSYFNCIFQASTDVGEDLHMKPQRCYSPPLDLSKAPEIENAVTVLQERLILTFSDASYEVRLATLKWLLKFLKAIKFGVTNGLYDSDAYIVHKWSKTYLQPSLMQALAVEENPRCTYYILRILFSWNLLQFQKSSDQCIGTIYVGGMDYDTVFEFWNKLLSLNKGVRNLKTRETLLCCMGICVKQFSCLFKSSFLFDLEGKKTLYSSLLDQPEKVPCILGCVNSFINLIKQHSASSEPINMRKAAAESIVASGLLAEAEYVSSFVSNLLTPLEEKCPHFDASKTVDAYAYGILDLWFTCIRLLEDEDVGLRQNLAEDVQRCFTLKASGTGRSEQDGVVPTQVEKVIEASFEFLSSVFGHWIVYFNYLSNWVLDTSTRGTLTRGDLVRRVFDKEIDNHHEEQLLICQFCCFHLEKLPISKFWEVNMGNRNEVISFLQKWRMRFYHQLISFSSDYEGIHDGVDWIGGMGNHKDTFISLYANLLGLYALSQCLFNGEAEIGVPLLTDLVELAETIRPFARNPLISNLFSLVIQLHERKLGIMDHFSDESRGDSYIWEGFDPYFLLR